MRTSTIVIGFVCVIGGCGPGTETLVNDTQPIQALPLKVADSFVFERDDKHMIAHALIENTTEKTIQCASVKRHGNMMLVETVLRDEVGNKLAEIKADEPKPPTKEDVSHYGFIGPGRTKVHSISLRSLVPDIKPGKYRLDLSYHVPKDSKYVTELELTPMSWEASLPVEIK